MHFTQIALLFLTSAAPALAQTYPIKPLRMLTAEPGGGSDVAARLVAQGLSAALGQQVVVDNRVGGINIATLAAHAAPDGYTLFTYSNSLWFIPLMRNHTPYDPQRDFAQVSLIGGSVMVLVTHPSVGANSVKELIALAKAKPGELNYATGPSGAVPHLAGELFKYLADLRITQVAYRGVGVAVTDVIGARVQMMFPNASAALPHVKAGRLRALAITSERQSALAPGLPTLAESGLPGYACTSAYATFAPAKTPPQIIKQLNSEITAYLNRAEVRERFLAASVEIAATTPEGLRAVMAGEIARFDKVIRAANIRLD
jgi:tripartite-type tricarboxylate transporter receptor subunit TctC